MLEPPTSFGGELRRIREAKGWTLREAARHLGVSFSRLGTWERGVDSNTGLPVVPPYHTAELMARVFRAPQLMTAAGYPVAGHGDDENELLDGYRQLGETDRRQLLSVLRQLRAEALRAGQDAESESQPGSGPSPTSGGDGGSG